MSVVLSNKTIVVTGASRGIGKEFCKQLADKGNRVIAACRTPEAVKDLENIAELTTLDVSDVSSITSWATTVASMCDHVDLLINNAGVYGKRCSFEEMDAQTMMDVFQTNCVGPLMVTQALYKKNLLGGKQGTIVAHVTSKMGSVDDNGSGGSYAYRASKSGLNIVNKSLSIDLAGDNITSTLLHPGWVITDMVNNNGLITTTTSVQGMLQVLEGKKQSQLQGSWHAFDGKVIPW
jgi:NAD(P)-dependent dehydrogenase (short-subunit alcohol dehydrogenase family)